MDLTKLHEDIAAIVDMGGISIGNYNDKSTWVVRYKSEPTKAQLAQVASIIKSYRVLSVDEMRDNNAAKVFLQSTDWKVIRHLEEWTKDNVTTLTPAEYFKLCADRENARKKISEYQ